MHYAVYFNRLGNPNNGTVVNMPYQTKQVQCHQYLRGHPQQVVFIMCCSLIASSTSIAPTLIAGIP